MGKSPNVKEEKSEDELPPVVNQEQSNLIQPQSTLFLEEKTERQQNTDSSKNEPTNADLVFRFARAHPFITTGLVLVTLIATGCICLGVAGLTSGLALIPGAILMAKIIGSVGFVFGTTGLAVASAEYTGDNKPSLNKSV